jgi:hypothetical protein
MGLSLQTTTSRIVDGYDTLLPHRKGYSPRYLHTIVDSISRLSEIVTTHARVD